MDYNATPTWLEEDAAEQDDGEGDIRPISETQEPLGELLLQERSQLPAAPMVEAVQSTARRLHKMPLVRQNGSSPTSQISEGPGQGTGETPDLHHQLHRAADAHSRGSTERVAVN